MRIRSVYPNLWTSLPVASLSVPARLTWIGLWNYADDEGRGKDDARLVKAALWALDDGVSSDDVESYVEEIAKAGLIRRYEVDGRRYFDVPSWGEHQRPKHPTPSRIPRCPESSGSPTPGLPPVVVGVDVVGVGVVGVEGGSGGDPLSKYLDKLREAAPSIFENVDRDWVLEMGASKGFTEPDVVEQLYEAWSWWTTRATTSQRAKKDGRRFLQTWFRRAREWASEHGQEPSREPAKTRCECDGGYSGHFEWCPKYEAGEDS